MDQKLKQRLIGAVVLVSLAVIFVPVILEGPRDEWAPRDHTIPEPPNLGYSEPTELPLPMPVPAVGKPQHGGDDAAIPAAVPEPPAAPAPRPVVKTPTPTSEKPSLATGWYVQVGSFSQTDNADRLRDRLRAAGQPAHRQSVKTGQVTGYRVLVGPSKTRPLAEKLQKSLSAKQQLKGIIIEIGPGEDK
jgi:DedD protein